MEPALIFRDGPSNSKELAIMQRNDNDSLDSLDDMTEDEKHKIYNPTGAVGNLGQDVPWTGKSGPEATEEASDFFEEIGAAILGKDTDEVHEPSTDENESR
jgi:hypothetical protein